MAGTCIFFNSLWWKARGSDSEIPYGVSCLGLLFGPNVSLGPPSEDTCARGENCPLPEAHRPCVKKRDGDLKVIFPGPSSAPRCLCASLFILTIGIMSLVS